MCAETVPRVSLSRRQRVPARSAGGWGVMVARVGTARRLRRDLVLRFWNNDVLQNIDGVLQNIIDTASSEPPHPNPLPAGEREHT